MQDRLNELESEFFLQLRRLKQIKPSQRMMPDGITPNEGFALRVIAHCENKGGQCRPGAIAELLHVTKSNASQILRSLGEKGFITREQSKDDYRMATLSLTDAGKAMTAQMDEKAEQQFHQVIDDFGADDFEQLVTLLDKFATCMESQQ